MKTVKQKVYLVLEYDYKNQSRVLGVYSTRRAATKKLSRSINDKHTYHIIKKSVQGTELLNDFPHFVIVRNLKEAF